MLIDENKILAKSNEDELKAKDNKLNSLENRIRELQLIIDSQRDYRNAKELIKLLKSQSKMQNVCVQKAQIRTKCAITHIYYC